MESLFSAVQEFCSAQRGKTFWIAYSGGLDSHVLLHVFAKMRAISPLPVQAVYINHGLSQSAQQWSKHCELVCQDLQIPFQTISIQAHASIGESPEDAARQARYAAFAELLTVNDVLVTAHHQDDQAETILLQMLRGAGPKGLAAMPMLKQFALGYHARPLLNFSRDELKKYAETHQLKWIEDESNLELKFSRNFIRHEVMPILKKRWPSVAETFSRVAEHCAEAQQLINEIAREDLQNVIGSLANTLSVQKLSQLNSARQRQVLREWLENLNFPLPSAVKLQQIQRDMLGAREDKSPHFSWRGVSLRRYRDDLFALPDLQDHDVAQVIAWDFSRELDFSSGKLRAELVKGQGLRTDLQEVTVRFRQGGEVCRLPGRDHHHELKNLFQEWGVPPWMRDRVPLIFVGEKLVAVTGYFENDEFLVSENEAGFVITFDSCHA
jgi:tRNA(Ile)-lysidine synthase